MATKSSPTTTVTFPNQQAIIDYINNHRINKEVLAKPERLATFPDATQKIAEYFANKKISREEILSHVKKVFSEETKEKESLLERVRQIVSNYELEDERIGRGPTLLTKACKSRLEELEAPGNLEITILMYNGVLFDLLLSKVTPPPLRETRYWGESARIAQIRQRTLGIVTNEAFTS